MIELQAAEHRDPPPIADEQCASPQEWHGWGSPIGLGIGLLCVAGFFVLLALGLSILASIS